MPSAKLYNLPFKVNKIHHLCTKHIKMVLNFIPAEHINEYLPTAMKKRAHQAGANAWLQFDIKIRSRSLNSFLE